MPSLLQNVASALSSGHPPRAPCGSLQHEIAGSAGFHLLRYLVAAILLVAAAGKTYSLTIGDSLNYSSLPIPLWLVYASIGVEWLLGGWLLLGIYPYGAWLTSIVCFSVFLCISLVAGIKGEEVCGCFGFLSTSPWLTALMDASILAALCVFRRSSSGSERDTPTDFGSAYSLVRVGCLLLAVSTASVVFAKGILAQAKASEDGENAVPQLVADAPGDPADCFASCISRAAMIARAGLGLDPAWPEETVPTDVDKILSLLQDAGKTVGSSVQVVPVAEAISSLRPGTSAPIVLISPSNHLYLLLGAVDIDGELMLQLLHGDSGMSLVPKSQLLESDFKEAWQLERTSSGVPIKVGQSGTLLIDRVLRNFGEVLPDRQLDCSFRLTNAGSEPIILDKPRTSCGCTTTDLPETIELPPGGTRDLQVVIHPRNSPSMRESVLLTAFEQGNATPRQQELLLVGNQRQVMAVAPTSLDFGTIVPGRPISRTIRMSEAPTDRFQVEGIDSGALPIAYEVEEVKIADGLAAYQVRLELKVDDRWSGEQAGDVLVTTSSRFRPQVTIPTRFEVAPRVRVEPSVVALGAIDVGESSNQRVRLVSRDDEPMSVTIASAPESCSVEVENQGHSTELIVTVTPEKAGIWQGAIEAEVRSGSSADLIEIKCVGFVRKASSSR